MTDNPTNEPLEDEVSDEAFAELCGRVEELAEAMRAALSHAALEQAVTETIQPVVVALALRQRDIGGHTLH